MRKTSLGVLVCLLVILLLVGACGEGKYVGSARSDIYHKPRCKWARKISSYNEIWFEGKEDAKSKGYRACKVCRP